MRASYSLTNPQQAHAVLIELWRGVKSALVAGHRLIVDVRQETRSDAQNRLLHSRLGDVAKHCEWAGAKHDVDTWRRLFMSAWMRTRNEHVSMLPALDGHGIDIVYASTTKLTRAECSDLSEYILFWGSEREVPWCPASLAEDAPPPRRKRETIDADGVITEEATA